MSQYLLKRPQSYYFRFRVPVDCQRFLGKKSIYKCLHTNDDKHAEIAAQSLYGEILTILNRVRELNQRTRNKAMMNHMIMKGININDGQIIIDRIELDPDKKEQELALLNGISSALSVSTSNNQKSDKNLIYVKDIASKFIEEKVSIKEWTQGTKETNEASINLLFELVGDNITNQDLSFELVDKFRSTLIQLPPNRKKVIELKSMSIEQQINYAKKHDKTISTITANNIILKLNGFFEWCRLRGYIDINYFSNQTFKVKGKRSDDRHPFTDKELSMIFNDPIFTELEYKWDYQYWIPLIAIYTGCRLNEICQLHTNDIYQDEDGVWIFDINDQGKTKKLKNKSAERLIPVHQHLIELGLIEFTNRKNNQNNQLLFEGLTYYHTKGYMKVASRWFGEFRKKYGLFNLKPKKDFHSFRCNVSTSFKKLGVDTVKKDELMGHFNESMGEHYSDDFTPAEKRDDLNKLDFMKHINNVKGFYQNG